jgi:hypothetical protein
MMLFSSLDIPPDLETYEAVQLGGNDVVHHATSVTNLERAGLDATDGSGTNDGDALLLGNVEDLTCTLDTVSTSHCGMDRVRTRSGTPSAMMAMHLICGNSSSSIVDWYTERDEAKLTTVSTSVCLAMALSTCW